MTEYVRVPRAWLEAFRRDTNPTEPIADSGETVWDMFRHEASAMLAASPQREGDWITHDGGPNPVPGKKTDVRFPDGAEDFGFSSEYWSGGDCDWWRHESDNPCQHIIAYRVTEGVKP